VSGTGNSPTRRDFDGLDEYARDRIASKLDEIVTDEWREPPEHLEFENAVAMRIVAMTIDQFAYCTADSVEVMDDSSP